MSRWEAAHVDELERLPADDEGLTWRPVRRRFDLRALGCNAYTAEEAGQRVVEEHAEAPHEEVYVVVAGRALFTVAGDEVDVPAGSLVHVEPGVTRGAVAAEPGTTVFAVGGTPGEAFEISAWETVFAAYGYRRLGDAARGRALLEEAAAARPDEWRNHYHLACFAALDGERDRALEHLARAAALDPKAAEWAAEDEGLDSVRDDPRFPGA
jgi:mannose-6-phosphate isomerase-like protein (cupin superfamily)